MSTSYGKDEDQVPPDYAMHMCNLFAQLGARGAMSFSRAATMGLVPGTACSKTAPATCMSGSSPLSPQLVRVAFFLFLQAVRRRWYRSLTTTSTLFAGLWVTNVGGMTSYNPQVAQVSPPAASFRGRATRITPYPPSSRTWAAAITAFTGALATVTRHDLFSLYNLCSAEGHGFPDFALQALGFEVFTNGKLDDDVTDGMRHELPDAGTTFLRQSPSLYPPPSRTLLTTNVQVASGGISQSQGYPKHRVLIPSVA